MRVAAELDADLARAYGITIATSAWLPAEDAEPDAVLIAAEAIGAALGDRRSEAPPADPGWVPLPERAVATPSPAERRAAVARVLAWAETAGARWNGIVVHVDDDGNAAIRASRALAPGEPILSLPRRLMIIDNQLGAATSGLRPRDALAAWLVLESNEPGSRWHAFLDAQPAHLADVPMFRGDLAALAGTAAYAITAGEVRDAREAYDQLTPELRARISLADFAWGCAIVQSRGFHAPGTLEHRIALLPVVEFFNHRLGDTTWSFDPTDGLFVIRTERSFAAGDDVHFPYGDRSTTQLLVHFGFAHPNNTADEAHLVFERASDPVADVAAHLMWAMPLAAPVRISVACRLDDRFLRALSLARLRASTPADRTRALEVGLAAYGDMPWLGGEHERRAFAEIADAARRGLAELAVPISETHTPWDDTCAMVRAAETAVLAEILELTRSVDPYLTMRDPEALRTAAADAPRMLGQYLRALADQLPA